MATPFSGRARPRPDHDSNVIMFPSGNAPGNAKIGSWRSPKTCGEAKRPERAALRDLEAAPADRRATIWTRYLERRRSRVLLMRSAIGDQRQSNPEAALAEHAGYVGGAQ